MAQFLRSFRGAYREQLARNRNRRFLKAAMAACALVATADGRVSFSEAVRVDQILQTLEKLKVFDPHDGVNLFRDYCEAIFASSKKGRERALSAVRGMAGDPETAALLLRVCLAVSEANGEMPLADQIEIVTLCSRLGIDPENCGLYIDLPEEEFLQGKRGPLRPA